MASALVCAGASAQTLNQEESNPANMNWMKGFPPAAENVISATDGSFFQFPALRYSVCHMREFFPTKQVPCAETDRYTFDRKIDKHIDEIRFETLDTKETITWKEAMDKSYMDGVIILHKGKVVYEDYFGIYKPGMVHAVMSVSKTFTGTLAAMLVAEGTLDPDKFVSEYVPELKESAFGDATVRELMDMTTALKYSEDYADPNAEVYVFSAAGTPCHPAGYNGPANYWQYLETVQKDGEHGKRFAYKTINTDALSWVIARVTGKDITTLLSERIWQPIGANHDGYYQIDSYGIPFAGGGFNANLEDLAKFGEMVRCKGKFNGKRIMPESVFYDIIENADNARFDQEHYPMLKGWGYRNMWWVTNNEDKAFCARGVYGQTIYVDPAAEMVIVRQASAPVAANSFSDPWSLPAYQAVADYLKRK